MDDLELLEFSLAAFEKTLEEPVTIIDNDGIFNYRQKRPVFTGMRASHKKIGACRCIFSEKCIRHCRYRINELCREKRSVFVSVCPNRLAQITVPLRWNGVHYGVFYLGVRSSGPLPENNSFPESFRREYAKLSEFTNEDVFRMERLGSVFADGVIHMLFRTGMLSDTPDFRNARIRDFLRAHLGEKIGLPDLAKELELSDSHTSVLVRNLFGCSFTTLLQRFRVEEAIHCLAGGGMHMREISVRCGFSSEFHLSRVFRKHTGVPPGKYFFSLKKSDSERKNDKGIHSAS